jgi:hypothetical protein
MSVINLKGRKPQTVDEKTEVYIGRACYMGGWALARSPWANPYGAKFGTIEARVVAYETYIRNNPSLLGRLGELRGKVLCCWCRPGPCHGDVLLKLIAEMDKK